MNIQKSRELLAVAERALNDGTDFAGRGLALNLTLTDLRAALSVIEAMRKALRRVQREWTRPETNCAEGTVLADIIKALSLIEDQP